MRYWFDAENRIAAVDEAWLAFAVENGAPQLTPERVRGVALADFINDRRTVRLWEAILARARGGAPVTIGIRCDSPERKRNLLLHVTLEPDGRVRVHSQTLSEEARAAVSRAERPPGVEDRYVRICSWCKRVEQAGGQWVELEAAAPDPAPRGGASAYTHAICEACLARVRDDAGLD